MRTLVSYRRSAAAIALSASMFAGAVAIAAPAQAASGSELRMLSYTNAARHAHGLRSLRLNSRLSDVARAHSRAMAARHRIFHTSNLVSTLRSFSWHVAGENVGMGPTMSALYRAFMLSAPHRANILYPLFRTVGIGVVRQSGVAYITVMFLG